MREHTYIYKLNLQNTLNLQKYCHKGKIHIAKKPLKVMIRAVLHDNLKEQSQPKVKPQRKKKWCRASVASFHVSGPRLSSTEEDLPHVRLAPDCISFLDLLWENNKVPIVTAKGMTRRRKHPREGERQCLVGL